MIEVDNVTKFFGPVLAVDHVSFQVAKGEIVGFLGPNGAGKTTTMRILTTFIPATSGIARVAKHDVMTESLKVRRNIGYLPESVPLYPEMRVEEYLNYRAKLKGVDRKERQKRIDYSLERCRIREVGRRLIGTLSRGYRQRVGLADTLIHDPPILILDEPTAGLDPIQINETLKTIKELGKDHTIILSTHILDEVQEVCGRIIIISRGRIGLDSKLSAIESAAFDITLEVRGPTDDVTKALHAVEGVVQVKSKPSKDGIAGYEVRTKSNKDLREEFAERIIKSGWSLRQLGLRRATLRDRFYDVVFKQHQQQPIPTLGSAEEVKDSEDEDREDENDNGADEKQASEENAGAKVTESREEKDDTRSE